MIPVFDLDGTLLDSDDALLTAFEVLGVARDRVRFGYPLADECARLRVRVTDYLAVYDPAAARPYPGVDVLVRSLPRWAVCSNKHPDSGALELAALGWRPEVAVFAGGSASPKKLAPVLAQLSVAAREVIFVGDTPHDRQCAREAGCAFALAAWNPRAVAEEGDIVLKHPSDLRSLIPF